MKQIGLLLVSALITFTTNGQNTCTSVSSGDWDQASTWSCNYAATIPDTNIERIAISASHIVNIVGNTYVGSFGSPEAVEMIINGTLFFAPPFPPTLMHLPQGSVIYVSAMGTIDAGNWLSANDSGLIRIAGNTVWFPLFGIGGDLHGPGRLDENSNGALPIELFEYYLEVETSQIIVNWSTLSEKENDFFVLQRSRDGISFEDLAIIEGAGTSSDLLRYSYTDYLPYQGNSYYRLSQTDYDGTTEVFKVIIADFHGDNNQIEVVQQSDNLNQLKILSNLDGENYGQICDVLGHGSEKFEIDRGVTLFDLQQLNYEAGIYFLRVSNAVGEVINSQRIMVNQ